VFSVRERGGGSIIKTDEKEETSNSRQEWNSVHSRNTSCSLWQISASTAEGEGGLTVFELTFIRRGLTVGPWGGGDSVNI